MRRIFFMIPISIICLGLLAGCKTQTPGKEANANVENTEIIEETNPQESVETNANTISPLPETLDINNLNNCTVAVSFNKGDVYVDDSGKAVMNATVYSYELYDMVDIAMLKENDIIVRKGEEVTITALERLDTGLVRINGGEENGGFELISDNNTVFFEIGMSDAKAYYELGLVTLPVSTEFTYSDESDLDAEVTVYYAGDFLTDYAGIVYNFTPHNTSIVIEDGFVIAMKKVYTP